MDLQEKIILKRELKLYQDQSEERGRRLTLLEAQIDWIKQDAAKMEDTIMGLERCASANPITRLAWETLYAQIQNVIATLTME